METMPMPIDSIGPSNDFFSESRSVWVALCGKPEVEGFRVWFHKNSTFGDLKREIASMDPVNLARAIILQPHYSHDPYWTQPDPSERISDICLVLYAVATGEDEPFLLGLVRTPGSDYPIAIGIPSHPSTIRQAIVTTQPRLAGKIKSITEHSADLEIGDSPLDFTHHVNESSSTFPTVFCITTNEGITTLGLNALCSRLSGSINFLCEAPGFVAPLLQTPMVHCEYLLRRAITLDVFHAQVAHLLQAARHISLSIADALAPLFDNRYADLDDVLISKGSLAELLPVAPLLAGQLKRILDRIEQLMRVLRTEEPAPESIKEVIDYLFGSLCGDFPGAAVVRRSYSSFMRLATSDYESLLRKYDDKGPPDDLVMVTTVLNLQTSIMRILKEISGDANPSTSKSMLSVAATKTTLGQYSDAKSLQSKALKHLRKRVGEKHPDTITAMLGLASTYMMLGRFSDAEKLDLDAVSLLKAVKGDEHPHTYKAMSSLACTYHKQDRNSEAAVLQNQALEGLTAKLGLENLDTLDGARQLALVYAALGRYSEAEALQNQVIDGLKSTLGQDHRLVHVALLELALTYYKQGRYSEAASLQTASLERLRFKVEDGHPGIFIAMREFSLTCTALGRYLEAEKLQLSALEGLTATLGEQHIETCTVHLDLTSTYYRQGRYSEAEIQQLRCLEQSMAQFGWKSLSTLTAKRLIALTNAAQGKLTEAANLQQDTLFGLRDVLGDKHPDTLIVLREHGWNHWGQGHYNEAIEFQLEALNGLRETLGVSHPETLVTSRDCASTYNALGRHSEARAIQEPAVRGLEEKLGLAHPDVIIAMLNLAETYSILELHTDARKMKDKALEGLLKTEVQQHAGIFTAINKLVLVYQSTASKSVARRIQRIQKDRSISYQLIKLLRRLDPVQKDVGSDADMGGEDENMEEDIVLSLD